MMGAHRKTLTLVLVSTVVLAGCSKEVEADCQLVQDQIKWQFERETSSPLTQIYAVPSRTVEGSWLMAAQTSHGVAVWASTAPPEGDGVGIVFPANEAAHADAILDETIDTQGLTIGQGSTIGPLLEDKQGIAAAEACAKNEP